jgi:hypothetical protein
MTYFTGGTPFTKSSTSYALRYGTLHHVLRYRPHPATAIRYTGLRLLLESFTTLRCTRSPGFENNSACLLFMMVYGHSTLVEIRVDCRFVTYREYIPKCTVSCLRQFGCDLLVEAIDFVASFFACHVVPNIPYE